MARRPISVMLPGENGPRVGGSGTELRVYTDAALTTLASLYANGASGATVPNPATPNAGGQTQLTAPIVINDTTLVVVDVSPFAVGNVISVYDGTNTRERTVIAINAGTKTITVDALFDVGFLVAPTLVNAQDMIGHIRFWLDTAQDYYAQVKNVGSARVLPWLSFPIQVPVSAINFQEEGVSTGSARQTLNVQGIGLLAKDNAGQARVDLSYWRHDLWTVGVL